MTTQHAAQSKKPLPTAAASADLETRHFNSHFEPDMWLTKGSPWEVFRGGTFVPNLTQEVAELGTKLRMSLTDRKE
jgi:hypothetical protein